MGYDARAMIEPRSGPLWVVLPVYEEAGAIERVFAEWLPALRATGADFKILAIDDGSRDQTLALLHGIARGNPELEVVGQANRGHGATCIVGYHRALAAGAGWVLQIDSDGQCDPRYFAALWAARREHPVVFGYRGRRDDGWARWLISRLVSVASLAAAGTWVRDANVPYRLMRSDLLARALEDLPGEPLVVNVLLAVRLRRAAGIHWVPIHFRQRHAGATRLRAASFVRLGRNLLPQLWAERQRVRR